MINDELYQLLTTWASARLKLTYLDIENNTQAFKDICVLEGILYHRYNLAQDKIIDMCYKHKVVNTIK